MSVLSHELKMHYEALDSPYGPTQSSPSFRVIDREGVEATTRLIAID